jgi:transposase
VPTDHPLRPVREMTDAALRRLSACFEALYSPTGRPSVPPEKLLRALLLQILYSIRSERMLIEQLEYNLLFRWFVGLSDERAAPPPDDPGNPTVDFHGERRSNTTHQSTTDEDCRLMCKGGGGPSWPMSGRC